MRFLLWASLVALLICLTTGREPSMSSAKNASARVNSNKNSKKVKTASMQLVPKKKESKPQTRYPTPIAPPPAKRRGQRAVYTPIKAGEEHIRQHLIALHPALAEFERAKTDRSKTYNALVSRSMHGKPQSARFAPNFGHYDPVPGGLEWDQADDPPWDEGDRRFDDIGNYPSWLNGPYKEENQKIWNDIDNGADPYAGYKNSEEHKSKSLQGGRGTVEENSDIRSYLKGGLLRVSDAVEHVLEMDYGFSGNIPEAIGLINRYLTEGLTLPLALAAAHLFLGGFVEPGDAEKMARRAMQYGASALPASYVSATAGACHNGIRSWKPVITEQGPGIVVDIHQLVCAAGLDTSGATDMGFHAVTGGATLAGGAPESHSFQIGPALLRGRLAGLATWYSRWLPITAEVEYTPIVGTTTSGSIAMGIARDGKTFSNAGSPTYAQTLMLGSDGQCTEVVPYQRASMFSSWGSHIDDAEDFLYTESNDTPDGSQRLVTCAEVFAVNLTTPAAPAPPFTDWGMVTLSMSLVLAGPSFSYGLTSLQANRRLLGDYAFAQFTQALSNKETLFRIANKLGCASGFAHEDEETKKVMKLLQSMGVVPPQKQQPEYVRWLQDRPDTKEVSFHLFKHNYSNRNRDEHGVQKDATLGK